MMEQNMLKKLLSMDVTFARPDPSRLGELTSQTEEEADYSRYDRLLSLLLEAIEEEKVEKPLVDQFQYQLQIPRYSRAREVLGRKQQHLSAQDIARDLGWTVENVYRAEYRAILAFRMAKRQFVMRRKRASFFSQPDDK